MASGTSNLITENFNSFPFRSRITWTATPNAAENTSRVIANLQIRLETSSPGAANFPVGKNVAINYEMSYYFSDGTLAKNSGAQSTNFVVSTSWTTIATYAATFLHFDDGTGYATLDADAWIGSLGSVSARGVTITFDKIQRNATITAAPNFNDEQNPTISYSNPAGANATLLQACISFDGSKDDIPYRDISKTASSYTFNLTNEERDILRAATLDGKNTRTVYFYIKSTVNGNTTTARLGKTLTIINCEPTIHATYYDINAKTVALTRNNGYFIMGYSNCEYQLDATPKKGATITNYKTVCGSKSSTAQRSTFSKISAKELTFAATDNRGQTGKLTMPLDVVEYFEPSCEFEATNIALDAESGTTATADVEVKGKFFNSTFGADGVANVLKIEILHTGLDDWFELPSILWGENINGNDYAATFSINGLDYNKKIDIQFRVSDKLTTTPITTDVKSLKLKPVFDWGENDFNFNVPVKINGDLVVSGTITSNATGADYIVERGTAAMGSNGTWYWSKWASGKAECYGTRNYGNMAVSNTWGSGFFSAYFSQALPSIFSEAPTIMDISVQGTDNGYAWIARSGLPTAAESGDFVVCRFTSGSISQVRISFHAIGKWK